MELTQEQVSKLNEFVNTSLENKTKWDYDYPCSAWASDAWNLVSEKKLEDQNLFGIGVSNPNTLADSIRNQLINDLPVKNFLFSILN